MFFLAMLSILAWLLVKPQTIDLDVKVCGVLENEETQGGQNNGKLKKVFKKYSSDKNKSISCLVQALQRGCQETDAPVTYKQASQIIKAWTHFTNVRTLPSITFGEFCLCALECKAFSIFRRVPPCVSTNIFKTSSTKMIRSVFLGGSCNPTTWRKDIAIPALMKLGVEYFNPQNESEWTPQMLKIEEDYKMSSDVMLYVIDSQTRATASMVEAAFMAGASYPVVLVMLNNLKNGHISYMAPLSPREAEELQNSKVMVTHLSKSSGIPVFTNLESAIQHISEMRTPDITKEELDEDFSLFKYPGSLISVVKRAFRSHAVDDEFLLFNQIESAVRSVLVWDKNTAKLKLDAANLNLIDDQFLSWDGFCSLLVEILLESQVISRNIISNWGLSSYLPWNTTINYNQTSIHIYGRLELLSNHLCFLKKLRCLGVHYYMYETQARESHRQGKIQHMEKSSLLLYNIMPEELALETMIQAAYDIGRGENVLLSVADVQQDGIVDGKKLSPRAVRDYNRGRAYLKDIATKHGVPVFNELDDVISYIKHLNWRSKIGPPVDLDKPDYKKIL